MLGGDVYWDHPMNSSVRYETDFWPFKVATDVVLNGTAYAPGGEPATSCVVVAAGRRSAQDDRRHRRSRGAVSWQDATPVVHRSRAVHGDAAALRTSRTAAPMCSRT